MRHPCFEQQQAVEDPLLEEPGFICSSAALQERERGMRFRIAGEAGPMEAFVVRFRGALHGYINKCPHIPEDNVMLDEPTGVFFDRLGRNLVCRRHAAMFDAESGACVRGPCRGAALVKIDVEENEEGVYWRGTAA